MGIWSMIFWAVAVCGFAVLAGGFLGPLHPAGESLAVLRGPVTFIGALWIALGWRTGVASPLWLVPVTLVSLPVLTGYTRYEAVSPPPETVTVYQKNMSYRIADTSALEADIREVAPDVLTLQELMPEARGMLDNLSDILPNARVCEPTRVGSVALATRWPAVEGSEICVGGLAALQVETPEGRAWVVSLHLEWPWPFGQSAHVRARLKVLEQLDGPVVLGGDFNMVPWSHAMHRIASSIGAERAGKVRPSFPLNPVLVLPIDHVLIPAGNRGATTLRPLLGSDHRGLVARY
ncbi:endonuclease/exonuclease/phosphatase family protein [Tropicimonas aquimaris]|uniref:Endonuclease/exonuclease/phosphatase family protein n=1 Tax=Tropicimonas aquimaris TaxID=914152 RepID=A0ABW3INQ9_9RHOB